MRDNLEDFNAFLPEFQDETDRGAALVGAALIDQRLKETLASFFAEPNVGKELLRGPLQSLSARIKAAFCLGLIDRHEYDECNRISKIRNKFAHWAHGTTFSHPKIAGLCSELKSTLPGDVRDNPRHVFTFSVITIGMQLMNRSKHVAQEKREIRKESQWTVIQAQTAPRNP